MNVGGPGVAAIDFIADDPSLIVGPIGLTAQCVPVPSPYHTERFTMSPSIIYSIPVPAPGIYSVKTLHNECSQNTLGERIFNVLINDAVNFLHVDIFAAVGMNTPLVLTNKGIKMPSGGNIKI